MTEFADTPLRIGAVALTVHDLDGVGRFYRQVVGLEPLESESARVRLGTGGRVLLELRHDPAARTRSAAEAGLFHTAFLLPARADLGRWLRHAAEQGVALTGAADHVVSEAVYLDDPEGNGIEIYADRPRAHWTWQQGTVVMRNDRLDRDGLLEAAGASRWAGAPAGTTVGHVHLQVGDVALAEAFAVGVLGMAQTARLPAAGFFASGGYHHHLGANIWNSRAAPPRDLPSTGLAQVQILAAGAEELDAITVRAEANGREPERQDGLVVLRDPWNTEFALAVAAQAN